MNVRTGRKLLAYMVVSIMGLWPLQSLQAETTDADDAKLQVEQQHIDKDKTDKTDDQKVDSLAKQFNVPESTVRDLRTKGQGWGEITIGLSTAQELAKTDPKTYPTLTDALNKVESMRASGEGWGKIAKDLGFKLGPVVSAAHHARHELHETVKEERAEKEGHGSHHEEMGAHEHGDHAEHQDHSARPDHPNMPDRPGR